PPPLALHSPRAAGTDPPSLHDALPILIQNICISMHKAKPYSLGAAVFKTRHFLKTEQGFKNHALELLKIFGLESVANHEAGSLPDRKSTRLNSSHVKTSYAAFCS